jgi:uncharacterized protein involved in outer membrane biogenesis
MKALKRLVKVFVGVLVVLVVLLVVSIFFLDSIVEKGINTAAPALLGVNTHVDSVSIRPFRGIVQIKNLTMANPEGYTTEKKLFEVTEFYVNINMASLFSDTIKIRKILIQGPGCTYEVKEGTSNIDALIAKLNKGASSETPPKTEPNPKTEPAPTEQPQEKKPGKKVIIDDLSINDTRLAYSSSITAGQFVTIPIVSITLKDIGKKDGGATFSEALTAIMNGILGGVSSAASSAGASLSSATKSATEATKATTDALSSGAKETSKAVGSALDEVGGLFKSKKKE